MLFIKNIIYKIVLFILRGGKGMKKYLSSNIRNVAILGHTGSGKTTITEAALSLAKHTTRFGKVEEGNTVSDYDAEEIRRRISISSSIVPIEWRENKINFIDTPGFFDFSAEVYQALKAADLAVIVVSAKSGVEVGTEKAWEYTEKAGVSRMIFINGMDDENADYESIIEELKEKFGKSVAPMQAPIFENGRFVGYINAIKREGHKYLPDRTEDCAVPSELYDEVEMLHGMINETVAETDEDLMEKFFNGEDFSVEEIHRGLKAGIIDRSCTPVVVGSAIHLRGIGVLMDKIVQLTPASEEMVKTKAKGKNGEEAELLCKPDGALCAYVFKTVADTFGKVSIFKVLSGTITRDTQLYNCNKEQAEKIGQLYVIRGKEQIAVTELCAGDIGAIPKLSVTQTCDTLAVKEMPFVLPAIEYPKPLYSLGIMPKNKGDEDKISGAIARFLEEDKTLKFTVNSETKQSVISGLGDSHLDVLVNRMKARNKIEVELKPLVIPFRETIKGKSDVQGRHKKQSGGAGQFGDVKMKFEPSGDFTREYVFEQTVFGGSVPKQYFPAVEKGIQESVKNGTLAGYPVVGLKAVLYDGSYHPVDSNELSFKLAAILAFKEGFAKAKPIILEPIMKVEIIVSDAYTGDIIGDINKRRGRILGMTKVDEKQQIQAQVPMMEMISYATELRSITQGRGEFIMEFEQYEEAPADIKEKVVADRKA